MIRGRTVTLRQRIYDERDSFGNYVKAYADAETVDNVLVQPGSCSDLDASRPEGVRVALTLHFPKTWSGDLRGAKIVSIDGYSGSYEVISIPQPYQDELCPTDWHMTAEVVWVDG